MKKGSNENLKSPQDSAKIIGIFKKRRKWVAPARRVGMLMLLSIIIGVCGISGYYLYSGYRERQIAADEARTTEAREKLQDTYFQYSGDEDRKIEYTKLVGQGKTDEALRVYESSISAASDENQKAWVYKELFNVAYHLGQYEHAKQGAIGYAKIRKSLDSYQAVVVACEQAGDSACQIEYLQAMYDSLNSDVTGEDPVRVEIAKKLQALGVEV